MLAIAAEKVFVFKLPVVNTSLFDQKTDVSEHIPFIFDNSKSYS